MCSINLSFDKMVLSWLRVSVACYYRRMRILVKNSNVPRKHHYIPVSYLANFTNEGTERSKL